MSKTEKINVFTIRKIKSIDESGKIYGKILHEDYELVGKLIKDKYTEKGTDKDGKETIKEIPIERREHIYPTPGKSIIISGKKYMVHSITIPEEINKNKIINVQE